MRSAFAISIALACLAAPTASAENLGTERGFTYSKETVTMPSGFVSEDVTANCPGKKVSVGGGSELAAAGAEHLSWLSESSGSDPDGWFASAAHQPTLQTVEFTTYAICTKRSKDIRRYEKTIAAPKAGPIPSSAKCKKGSPSGGGVRLVDDVPTDWFLATSTPADLGQPDAIDGWQAVHRRTGMSAASLTTDVVCIQGGKAKYRTETFETNALLVTRGIDCPGRKSVAGGGATAVDGPTGAHLLESRPVDGHDDDLTPDDGWLMTLYNDGNSMQDFTITAICR